MSEDRENEKRKVLEVREAFLNEVNSMLEELESPDTEVVRRS